jgi:hypothetical protein
MLCKLNSSFKVVVTTYQVKSPCNVCVLFWQQYPEYYRVIKEPIDLKIIYSQVKVGQVFSLYWKLIIILKQTKTNVIHSAVAPPYQL